MSNFNASTDPLDFFRGCVIDFDKDTGRSNSIETKKRYLSQMKGMFHDAHAYDEVIKVEDPLVYEFHDLPLPENSGDLIFGCSILHPGKIGDEYYFTKGHFHHILETAEVYYCLHGHGYMLLENPEGDWAALEMEAGKVVYVPKRYAHRSINVSLDSPLVSLFVYRADGGHDYRTIEIKGYRKLLIEENGRPVIKDNPNWK